jgi:hypothetical protein
MSAHQHRSGREAPRGLVTVMHEIAAIGVAVA